jgi:hypothetical protein
MHCRRSEVILCEVLPLSTGLREGLSNDDEAISAGPADMHSRFANGDGRECRTSSATVRVCD